MEQSIPAASSIGTSRPVNRPLGRVTHAGPVGSSRLCAAGQGCVHRVGRFDESFAGWTGSRTSGELRLDRVTRGGLVGRPQPWPPVGSPAGRVRVAPSEGMVASGPVGSDLSRLTTAPTHRMSRAVHSCRSLRGHHWEPDWPDKTGRTPPAGIEMIRSRQYRCLNPGTPPRSRGIT